MMLLVSWIKHRSGASYVDWRIMAKTAILVDGGFYKRVAEKLWGYKEPEQRADELYQYAILHITEKRDAKIELERRELYRIFYYDCPPIENAAVYHPLKKRNVNFNSKNDRYKWNHTFQKTLGEMRKVALRFGKRVTANAKYNLKPDVTKGLLSGKTRIEDLTESDFILNMKQSGVDMRIGLDIASLAYEGIVDQIILISGDVDFVPAAKVARRRGIDFIVDNMGEHIRDDLKIHADGIITMINSMNDDGMPKKRRSAERSPATTIEHDGASSE